MLSIPQDPFGAVIARAFAEARDTKERAQVLNCACLRAGRSDQSICLIQAPKSRKEWMHNSDLTPSSEPVLRDQYRGHGLKMLGGHAALPDGPTSVEAGIMTVLQDMEVGKCKVFSSCRDWFKEQALYHRKEGKIVKELDDLMDATRYAHVMLRFAKWVRSARRKWQWATAVMD